MSINVEDHFGLIWKVVRRFYGDREELFQVGCVGLLKAKKKYKAGTFSTFAYHCIYNEISKFLLQETKHTNEIRRKSKREKIHREEFLEYLPYLSKQENKFIQLKGDGYKLKEISKKLNIPEHKVSKIYKQVKKKINAANPVSQ